MEADSATMLNQLPRHLRERVRVARSGRLCNSPVVYWMRSSLRGHENPALDVAILAANALKVPMLVLLHVEDTYPSATARRQHFLLEGAREAQAELLQRGLHVHVQVDCSTDRQKVHLTIAERASLMVVEEPFCVPWLAAFHSLSATSKEKPIWLVDCCSVVPSALVPKSSCHRAYAYEKATQDMHQERISMPWPDQVLQNHEDPRPLLGNLPQSADLTTVDLSMLVKRMDVDMAVPPVQHTVGGSSFGYARWHAWMLGGGLKTYAKRRNDSLDIQGVSRMSAYLNLGMVSPMRLAREASMSSGAGKGKFLNEFLTWRGLSYAHCYHFPMSPSGATLAQLPRWAQETLRRHASDPRKVIDRAHLAAGRSGDRSWDAMQRYLVQTGELHNNARMGWGKAVLMWTGSPEEALDALLDLNNRFALDGHAPPSYGGLLGCLGLFEGPKQDRSVTGTVSFKPPKGRYAAMLEVANSLPSSSLPSRSPEQGQMQLLFTPAERSGQQQRDSRRQEQHQLQQLQQQPQQHEPTQQSTQAQPAMQPSLSKPGGNTLQTQMEDRDTIPRKRRWVLKAKATECVDLC